MSNRKTLIENLENVVSILETVGAVSVAQDARDAIDLVERLTFVWSSEKPSVAGDYLMRERGRKTPVVFGTFSDQDIKNPSPWINRYEFAGPFVIAESTPESGGQS